MITIVTVPTMTGNSTETVRVVCPEKGKLTGVTLIRTAGANDPLDDAVVQVDVVVYDDLAVDIDHIIYSATITTATSLNVDNPLSVDETSVKKQFESETYREKSEANPRLTATIQLSGLLNALVTNYDFKLKLDMEGL
tara:strand:+ start:1409 stop:1822 length:414 start_codon:yes stop_codon:yes gene_type:complete